MIKRPFTKEKSASALKDTKRINKTAGGRLFFPSTGRVAYVARGWAMELD